MQIKPNSNTICDWSKLEQYLVGYFRETFFDDTNNHETIRSKMSWCIFLIIFTFVICTQFYSGGFFLCRNLHQPQEYSVDRFKYQFHDFCCMMCSRPRRFLVLYTKVYLLFKIVVYLFVTRSAWMGTCVFYLLNFLRRKRPLSSLSLLLTLIVMHCVFGFAYLLVFEIGNMTLFVFLSLIAGLGLFFFTLKTKENVLLCLKILGNLKSDSG